MRKALLISAMLMLTFLVTVATPAQAICIYRSDPDTWWQKEEHVCAEAQPGGSQQDLCLFVLYNPALPGTWYSSTTCSPVPCPPAVCAMTELMTEGDP